MKDKKIIELREKILKGIELSYERLVQSKIKSDGEIVISRDGKVVIIKAKDLIK